MREYSKRIPGDIQDRALMKLQQLNAAEVLKDLAIPASNPVELLRGDRKRPIQYPHQQAVANLLHMESGACIGC